jgi:glutathione S-transferase
MITLYSYPELYGLEDNNPYGLKVFAFLRLCGLPFEHRHVLDTQAAPRGQLPYLIDEDATIGDSDAIVAWLKRRYALSVDDGLFEAQRNLDLLLRRTLDDLYWVMSYSRWRDDRYWPTFRDALLAQHPGLDAQALEGAREYNFKRYHYQGIGRYEPDEVYARGVGDLQAIARFVPKSGFLFGERPVSTDAAVYGFVANIYYYEIDTPLKRFVVSQPHLVRYCTALREAVERGGAK